MSTPGPDDIQLDDNGKRVERDLLNSRIVGLFLESLVCGIFVVTYSMGTWSLLRRDHRAALSRRNKILIGANTLMLALAVVHLCLTLRTTLYGFVVKGDTRETTYDALFDNNLFSTPANKAQFYLYITQTLIGDGFMLYRLSIVWSHRRAVIIVPAILFSIDVVSGFCYALMPLFMALIFFAFSFFTNALSSTLIMWKVLRSESSEAQDHWRWHSRAIFNFVRYRRVFEAIIQSAAIYSAASISLLVTTFISPNIGLYACLCVFPPLIGLVFSLIVIQIARNTATSDHAPSRTTESEITLSKTVGRPGYTVVQRDSSPQPTCVLKMSESKHIRRSLSAAPSVDTTLVCGDNSRIIRPSEGTPVVGV
ncbi:hypothetical protein V8D89_006686 [Ganoderma adspersum]